MGEQGQRLVYEMIEDEFDCIGGIKLLILH